MHQTLSLGYTSAETKDCKKKLFFFCSQKWGLYTRGVIHQALQYYGTGYTGKQISTSSLMSFPNELNPSNLTESVVPLALYVRPFADQWIFSTCFFNFPGVMNPMPHLAQTWGNSFVWTPISCARKWPLWMNFFPQKLQEYGSSPVWVLLWARRLEECVHR